jgi:hypothetical protein
MHPDTPFANRYGASTKLLEMSSNMILGPKLVLWTRSLRPARKSIGTQTRALNAPRYPLLQTVMARPPNGAKRVLT